MKLQKTNHVFNGHDWMRRLRLPYWTIAKMREMRVGGELPVIGFFGPSMFENTDPGQVSCHVDRMKGSWRLHVLWMADIGKANRRGHIWSWVDFRLGTGSTVTLLREEGQDESNVLQAEYLVRRVCRLVGRLQRMAEHAGDRHSMVLMRPPPSYWRSESTVVPFLQKLAAPVLAPMHNPFTAKA